MKTEKRKKYGESIIKYTACCMFIVDLSVVFDDEHTEFMFATVIEFHFAYVSVNGNGLSTTFILFLSPFA